MLAAIGAIIFLSAVSVLQSYGVPMPKWLSDLTALGKPLDHPRVLLALGVIASTLQSVATMRAQISLSARNAERFAILATRFKELGENDLPRARAAAAAGDRAGVNTFTDKVMKELDAEASAWRDVRGAVRPLSKMPWGKKRKP